MRPYRPRRHPMNNYRNVVAVVTGAASGIGRELCAQLAAAGARIALIDIAETRLRSFHRTLSDGGADARAFALDVADCAALEQAITSVAREWGRIDYLFSNAGTGAMGEAIDLTMEHWKRVIDTNLWGVVNGVLAAYPIMVRQRAGHIVNTASLSGQVPMPFAANYVASKHAVVGLSLALRLEAESYGVKVSVVCPAAVDTSIHENSIWVGVDPAEFRKATPSKPISAHRCARKILEGVEKNDAVILPADAKFIWHVHRLFPAITRFMARRFHSQIKQGHESGSRPLRD